MSVPAQSTRRSSAMAREDCRDYLRTGRCKYGISCKYFHPPNVQSGGGMKTPTDPNEPMFPIRPTEPICQYYMKHGTCKFAQSCIFHHPPELNNINAHGGNTGNGNGSGGGSAGSTGHHGIHHKPATSFIALGGGGAVMNIGDLNGTADLRQNHTILSSSSSSSSSALHNFHHNQNHLNNSNGNTWASDPNVQILPQRPNEPNCAYFLKHGRCRFGATCRYHHPVRIVQTGEPGSQHDAIDNINKTANSNQARSALDVLAQNTAGLNKNGRTRGDGSGSSSGSRPNTSQHKHPIHVHQSPGPNNPSKLHYVTPLQANFQHAHFVMPNGSVSFMSLDDSISSAPMIAVPQTSSESPSNNNDSSSGGNGHKENNDNAGSMHEQPQHSPGSQTSVIPQTPSSDGVGKPLILCREVASSTSSTSIASSYDTMTSNADLYMPHGDSTSTLWTSRHSNGSIAALASAANGSTGAMGTFGADNSTGNTPSFASGNASDHSRSKSLPATQRPPTHHHNAPSGGVITGASQGDGAAPRYDSAFPPITNRVTGTHTGTSFSSSSTTPSRSSTWGRGRRSVSFDHTRSHASSQLQKSSSVPEFGDQLHSDDGALPGNRQPAGSFHGRRHGKQQRQQQPPREVDEGLSRMTSALLTMLDTTEEIPQEEGYDIDDLNDEDRPSSQASTPPTRTRYGTKAASINHGSDAASSHSRQPARGQNPNDTQTLYYDNSVYGDSRSGPYSNVSGTGAGMAMGINMRTSGLEPIGGHYPQHLQQQQQQNSSGYLDQSQYYGHHQSQPFQHNQPSYHDLGTPSQQAGHNSYHHHQQDEYQHPPGFMSLSTGNAGDTRIHPTNPYRHAREHLASATPAMGSHQDVAAEAAGWSSSPHEYAVGSMDQYFPDANILGELSHRQRSASTGSPSTAGSAHIGLYLS